jgi:hypothetical protein
MPEEVPASRPPNCTTDLLSARHFEVSSGSDVWVVAGTDSKTDFGLSPPTDDCAAISDRVPRDLSASNRAIDLLDWGNTYLS